MQNKPNNIDKLFHSAFKDAVMEPTPNAWNKIVSAVSGKYMVPATWWYAAAAAIFIGGIGVGYLWNLPKNDTTNYAKATIESTAAGQANEAITNPKENKITEEVTPAIQSTTAASTLAEAPVNKSTHAPKSLKNSTSPKAVDVVFSRQVDAAAFDAITSEVVSSVEPIESKTFNGFQINDAKPDFLQGKNTVDKLKLDELYALFAQNDESEKQQLQVSPTYGGRIASGYSNSSSDNLAYANADAYEFQNGSLTTRSLVSQTSALKYNRSVGFGVDGTFPFTDRLSFRYGLNFTRWEATRTQEVIGDTYEIDAFSNAQILVKDVVIDSKSFDYRINFIEAPLTVKWDFFSKKVKAFISSGVSLSYLTSASRIDVQANQTFRAGEKEVVTPKSGRMPISVIASTGIEYQLMKGLNLRVEPIFRAQLNKDETLDFNYPFNSISLNTGVYYSIN